MSSIRLKKERDGQKPGTVISVPFGTGQQLIADGIGERLSVVPVPTAEMDLQTIAATRDRIKNIEAESAAPPAPVPAPEFNRPGPDLETIPAKPVVLPVKKAPEKHADKK
jgi:hypothetical protein